MDGMPSADFRELLRKSFGVKKPDQPKRPAPLPIHDKPEEYKRSVGNPMLSVEAQRIYNPQLPPAPPTKPPTAPQVNRGIVGGMDMQGPWGQGNSK